MEIPPDALGFAVVIATLMGTALGVKLLVWGKGPIRKLRGGAGDPDAERVAELEQRIDKLAEFVRDQSRLIEDVHERLDFTERVLTQKKADDAPALEPPAGA